MLTVYKKPLSRQSSSSSSCSDESCATATIPAGQPYLTKVNGKLMLARDKRPGKVGQQVALDLLGEVFGNKITRRVLHKHSQSFEKQASQSQNPVPSPLLIGGIPYLPAGTQQPPGYSPPVSQQGFNPFAPPSMATMPQYSTPQYPQTPYQTLQTPTTPTFAMPNPHMPPPSAQDIEQLKRIDAHFNNTVLGGQHPRVTSASRESSFESKKDEETTKTTIKITKHVCANCGRLRSRRYHHKHPLKPGEQSAPEFCGKCQKEASSTSESDSDKETIKRKHKKKVKSREQKLEKKRVQSSSDSESDATPRPKPEKQENSRPKKAKQTNQGKQGKDKLAEEDYIIVAEEISDSEQKIRGRTKQRIVVKEYETQPPSSPLVSQVFRQSSPIAIVYRHAKPQVKISRECVRGTGREKFHSRAPSIDFRYVEMQSRHPSPELRREAYPRKVSVEFEEEIVNERPPLRQEKSTSRNVETTFEEEDVPHSRREEKRNSQDKFFTKGPAAKAYSVDEVESTSRGESVSGARYDQAYHRTAKPPSVREYYENEGETYETTRRLSDGRARRQQERGHGYKSDIRPWDKPHVVRPKSSEEVIVVTEHFEYLPKRASREEARRSQECLPKRSSREEIRRTQERADMATFAGLHRHPQYKQYEDAAKYYTDDWKQDYAESIPESIYSKEHLSTRGWRRETDRSQELSDSEEQYHNMTRSAHYTPPRAPSPPLSPVYESEVSHHDLRPPYPLSSDEGSRSRKRSNRHIVPSEISIDNTPHKYAYSVAATNPEQSIITSPRQVKSWERISVRNEEDDGFSVTNMSEHEREAEARTRNVHFRDTPSEVSVKQDWSVSEVNSAMKANGWTPVGNEGSGWNGGNHGRATDSWGMGQSGGASGVQW